MARIAADRAVILGAWNSGDRVGIKREATKETLCGIQVFAYCTIPQLLLFCINFRFNNYMIMPMHVFSMNMAGGDNRG